MRANKTRTALTVLGMVIGIGSVIIVYSAGAGIENLVIGQIERFGTDIIEAEIKVPTNKKTNSNVSMEGAADLIQGAQITSLTLSDMEDIARLPNVKDIYSMIMAQEQISYGNEMRKAFIIGTNASYEAIDSSDVETGRFFTEEENKSMAQVLVLGSEMKEKLFGSSDALGKMVKIRKTKFRVVGVMEEVGAIMGMSFDDMVYAPVITMQKKIMGIDHITNIVAQLHNVDLAEETARETRVILRENHDIKVESDDDYNKDDFRVVTMSEMMDMMGTITGAITLLLLAIVAISLVVGGVGIMNIMYVIVTERAAEIGLRKAVGATYSDIIRQFLIEALLITVAGGIAGIIFGIIISYVISIGANYFGLDWEFSIPLQAYAVSLGFSGFFGILFGVYPARKAARLDPIEALRSE